MLRDADLDSKAFLPHLPICPFQGLKWVIQTPSLSLFLLPYQTLSSGIVPANMGGPE